MNVLDLLTDTMKQAYTTLNHIASPSSTQICVHRLFGNNCVFKLI